MVIVTPRFLPRMIPAGCSKNHSKSSHGAKWVGPLCFHLLLKLSLKYGQQTGGFSVSTFKWPDHIQKR